ncbi:MAG: hypothetical protein MUC50_10305, partial [Myxococcota bacterium]|nr:hypothetical protein [Myxococcota bacterium]
MDMSWLGWNGSDIGALLSITNPILALAALVSLGLLWFSLRATRRWLTVSVGIFLHAVALLSIASYFQFGHFRFDRYINPHDVYHYYIGAKYSPEVGYTRQYCASAAADMEGRRLLAASEIRDLSNYKYIKVDQINDKLESCKARFSPSRWEEFKRDIEAFQDLVPTWKWQAMLKDKGYNATPAWTSIASRIANLVPIDTPWGRGIIVSIDLFLLALMFAGIGWAFGYRAMLLAVAFFGINYFTSCVHIKGAFMRFDWLVTLVLSVCAARKERFKTAGVLLGLSTASRFFPAVFAFGPLVLLVLGAWKTRKLDKQLVGFAAALVATSVLVVAATALDYRGVEPWQTFLHKMGLHNGDFSSSRVGFKYVFVHFLIGDVG